MLTTMFAVGSFGVLLHEVVSGVRPKLRSPMEPLRCMAGMLLAARARIACHDGSAASLTQVWCSIAQQTAHVIVCYRVHAVCASAM